MKLLSDTRWLCNEMDISSVVSNYSSLLDYFVRGLGVDTNDEDSIVPNAYQKAIAREFVNLLHNYRRYYSLRVLQDAYSVINPDHRIIHSSGLIILMVRDLIRDTLDRLLEKTSNWDALTAFHEKMKTEAEAMGMEGPLLVWAARRGRKSQVMTATQKEELLLMQYPTEIHKALLIEFGHRYQQEV